MSLLRTLTTIAGISAMAALALASAPMAQAADDVSPYVGRESRTIKALSEQETADLLAGRGMGYAQAAELNHYPGPLHVIELADRLALSPEQRVRTEQVFRNMQQSATALGSKIVAAERALDSAFADGTIDKAALVAQTDTLGSLYGRVRAVHLAAHIEMRELLTPEQRVTYDRLRGYAAGQSPSSSQHPGHH